MNRPVRIHGVGCCLLDRIYGHADFSSPAFRRYHSLRSGDGGLEEGCLTFEEELERFARRPFSAILPELTGGQAPDAENIGGPAIVALIHAAQVAGDGCHVRFYGNRGDDAVGEELRARLEKTPVDLSHYHALKGKSTPSTTVLSDPNADNGHGERTFVNTIGAAWAFRPEDVDDSFYAADICVFGGTALVPSVHAGLQGMLETARRRGCLTFVNTVYDSLSEKKAPGERWLLGGSDAVYPLVDLLVADREEALRLSGTTDIPSAVAFFREKGVGAVVVTAGAAPVHLFSAGGRWTPTGEVADGPAAGVADGTGGATGGGTAFGDGTGAAGGVADGPAAGVETMPVSRALAEEWKKGTRRGDSTGCGDNFAGGILASLAMQFAAGKKVADLREACRLGIVSGGFAGLYYGGTWTEKEPGEKRRLLQPYYDSYLNQSVPQP